MKNEAARQNRRAAGKAHILTQIRIFVGFAESKSKEAVRRLAWRHVDPAGNGAADAALPAGKRADYQRRASLAALPALPVFLADGMEVEAGAIASAPSR